MKSSPLDLAPAQAPVTLSWRHVDDQLVLTLPEALIRHDLRILNMTIRHISISKGQAMDSSPTTGNHEPCTFPASCRLDNEHGCQLRIFAKEGKQ